MPVLFQGDDCQTRKKTETPRRMLNEQIIRQALSGVKYPGYSRDIVSFGLVKQIVIRDDAVGVLLQLTTSSAETAVQIKQAAEAALSAVPGVKHADVDVKPHPPPRPPRRPSRASPASGASWPSPAARAASASPRSQ
jgi:metal-sulfur cluster biosynthetic enzyme